MSAINVTSEIGRLNAVMLHRPGNELLNLTPATLEELLFDDIPFLENAQKEHDAFASILRNNGVKVLYLEELMAQALSHSKSVRDQFLKQYIAEANIRSEYYENIAFEFLDAISDNLSLVLKTMEGLKLSEVPKSLAPSLTHFVDDENYMLIDPMPNLYFTRDPFACVGQGVSLNRMYSVTRNRETIYGQYIFKYHPIYGQGVNLFYERNGISSIEGGDVLNISKSVVAVGISQRTTADAIDEFAKNVFFNSKTEIKTVVAFDIPKTRAFMHLDTVFTQIDYDKFTIHPAILGPLRVFEITPDYYDKELRIEQIDTTLEAALERYTGTDKVELIQCAGGEPIAAAREQWNDGSNTLCISPGVIVVYDRNNITNEILIKKGLKVLEMPCGELSRGRGGPRCMSMPFDRDDL